MIIREFYKTRQDGVNLYRTYSNTNHYIKQVQTGVIYSEAVDVETSKYTYEETNKEIETYVVSKSTEQDLYNTLEELGGN